MSHRLATKRRSPDHDVKGSTAAVFRNFGTPTYYVVDGRGRIWFDEVERVPDLIAQVDAVKSMR